MGYHQGMDTLSLFLLAAPVVLAATFLAYVFSRNKKAGGSGILGYNRAKDAKKREHLEKIMALFNDVPALTNAYIREKLGFDDRTIVRYMDELEKEQKVEQVGDVGYKVHYRLK